MIYIHYIAVRAHIIGKILYTVCITTNTLHFSEKSSRHIRLKNTAIPARNHNRKSVRCCKFQTGRLYISTFPLNNLFSVANLNTTKGKSEIFREIHFLSIDMDFSKVGNIYFDIHLFIMNNRTSHTRRHARFIIAIFAHFLLNFKDIVGCARNSIDTGFLDVKQLTVIVGNMRITGCYAITFAWICNFFGQKFLSSNSALFCDRFALSNTHIFNATIVNILFVCNTK